VSKNSSTAYLLTSLKVFERLAVQKCQNVTKIQKNHRKTAIFGTFLCTIVDSIHRIALVGCQERKSKKMNSPSIKLAF
jgi:hypothetical protein